MKILLVNLWQYEPSSSKTQSRSLLSSLHFLPLSSATMNIHHHLNHPSPSSNKFCCWQVDDFYYHYQKTITHPSSSQYWFTIILNRWFHMCNLNHTPPHNYHGCGLWLLFSLSSSLSQRQSFSSPLLFPCHHSSASYIICWK